MRSLTSPDLHKAVKRAVPIFTDLRLALDRESTRHLPAQRWPERLLVSGRRGLARLIRSTGKHDRGCAWGVTLERCLLAHRRRVPDGDQPVSSTIL